MPGDVDSLWRRWTDGDRSGGGLVYEAAAVVPLDAVREPADGDAGGRPGLAFCSGAVRATLRNIPLVVLAGGAVSFVGEQVGTFYQPFGTYLPVPSVGPVGPSTVAIALVGLAWLWLLARQVVAAGIITGRTLLRNALFYGPLAVLLAGTAYAVALMTRDPGMHPHLTFRAGLFLFFFLFGHLVYDGLLRTETLFWHLGETAIVDAEGYAAFRRDLRDALADTVAVGPVSVSRAAVFAGVLVAPGIVVPFATTTLVLSQVISYAVVMWLTFVVEAVLFQFAVLVRYVHALLTGSYTTNDGSTVELQYRPFHPDERGGFRDLGRFATRVNLVLVLCGCYFAYRSYTGGVANFSPAVFTDATLLVEWFVFYLGPVLIYVTVAVLWLYHTFWRMHRKMQRGRRRLIRELQAEARVGGGATDGGQGTEAGRGRKNPAGASGGAAAESDARLFADPERDAPPWRNLRDAPVWPVDSRNLVGIVLLDAAPVVLALL